MPTLNLNTSVQCSPVALWNILAEDFANIQQYSPNIRASKLIGDATDGVGAQRHCQFPAGQFAVERITHWEPDRILEFQATEMSFPMRTFTTRWSLASEGQITQLSLHLTFEPTNLLGQIMAPLLRRRLGSGYSATLANVKNAAELLS